MAAVLWWGYKNRTSIFHWMRGEIVVNHDKYPIVGIDVSAHNGDIDFEKVRADGYTFVVIKASEGVDHHDSKFDINFDNARKAGLKVGAYHFFRKNTDGLNQAKNFLETIGWRKLDLPLVIDVEDWSNDKNVKDDRTQKHLDAMIDNLRSRGHQVMIYTNGDGYKKYIKDGQININLWLCAFKNPDKLKHIPHQMQQYSHWGRVKGIWGDVDLNVFNGSQQQWDKWLKDLTPYQVEEAYIDSTQIDDNEFYIIDDEI
jgi:lysozyme